MKKGWLVVNHFLNSEKFFDIYDRLCKSCKDTDIVLEKKTSAELMFNAVDNTLLFEKNLPDFVLFWDKDLYLAQSLESMGLRLFNTSRAIALCDDKALTHMALCGHNIKMPKTIIAPKTYPRYGYIDKFFIEKAIEELGFPMVIKECRGSFGAQVYLAKNEQDFTRILESVSGRPILLQEFVSSSYAHDIRINVVGKRAVATMYRYNENGDFRANITNGGSMKPYEPSQKQVDVAIKVCEILGLDFAGVDLLFGEDDEPILCEVNSNAHFKNIYDCTGINVADAIIEHISEALK